MATSRHIELELLPVHLWEEAYLTLCCTMVQRVRTAAGVLPGNFLKVQSQDLSSFLYASKRCSSTGSHGIFILVLEPCFFLLEYALSSLLRSGSLLHKLLSSSLLDGSLSSDGRAPALTALLYWSVVKGASSKTRLASTVGDKIVLLESRDEVCRLKPVKEERMLLYRLNGEVVNLPHMANVLNELGKLAERDSFPVATVPDHCRERAAACRV
jgi:hypothetical protein